MIKKVFLILLIPFLVSSIALSTSNDSAPKKMEHLPLATLPQAIPDEVRRNMIDTNLYMLRLQQEIERLANYNYTPISSLLKTKFDVVKEVGPRMIPDQRWFGKD